MKARWLAKLLPGAALLLAAAACVAPPLVTPIGTATPPASASTPAVEAQATAILSALTAVPLTATEPVSPAVTSEGPFVPLGEVECAEMAQTMSQALNAFVAQEVADFIEPISGRGGAGCQAVARGTGEQFESPIATVGKLGAALQSQGWTEDTNLVADGPTGTASGYRWGNQLCLAAADWNPSAEVSCPADQPISACQVPPSQQIYTVTLICAKAS